MATEQSSDEYDDDLPVPRHLHSTNFHDRHHPNQKRRNVRPDTDKARTQQKRVTSLQKKVETMAKQNGGQFIVLCALPNQQRWSGKTIVCGSYAHNFMGSALGQDLVKAWEAQFDELQVKRTSKGLVMPSLEQSVRLGLERVPLRPASLARKVAGKNEVAADRMN